MNALLIKSLVVLVCLVIPGLATGRDLSARGDRIFYLFSPDSAAERQRVVVLKQWLRERADGLELVAIARDGNLDQESPFLSSAAAARSVQVPEYIKARLDVNGDYFALTGSDGEFLLGGRGSEWRKTLSPTVATEVDESTWGKVKDLFR